MLRKLNIAFISALTGLKFNSLQLIHVALWLSDEIYKHAEKRRLTEWDEGDGRLTRCLILAQR